MTRLIDADEAIKRLGDAHFKNYGNAILIIRETPTVDAEPVRRGKWIMKSDPFGFFDEIPVCSECGCTTKMREKTKFCPNCGAKMGEQNDTD